MDLYNNELGRSIAVRNPDATTSELMALVFSAVADGRAAVVRDGKLACSADGRRADGIDWGAMALFGMRRATRMQVGMATSSLRFGSRTVSLLALLVIGILALTACATRVENDDALDERLASIQETGEEKRLRDLVPGDWTRVYVFDMEATTQETVEETVGHSVGMDVFFADGAILVFVNDEEVVRASAVYGPRFAYQAGDTESVVDWDATKGLLVLK